jgi:hypothetical protein
MLDLRQERRWRQVDLADRMRPLGFNWNQVTIAHIETLRRGVGLGDCFGLALAFEIPLAELFGSRGPDVMIGSGAVLPAKHIVALLQGTKPTRAMISAAQERAEDFSKRKKRRRRMRSALEESEE